MKKLTIMSYMNAKGHVNDFDGIISIATPNTDEHVTGSHVLSLEFDDIPAPMTLFNGEECTVANKDHIKEAIAFAEQHDNVMVHCLAGISRSTGIALALLMDQYDAKEAYEKLLQISPTARPNIVIVELLEKMHNVDLKAIIFEQEQKDERVWRNRQYELKYGRAS